MRRSLPAFAAAAKQAVKEASKPTTEHAAEAVAKSARPSPRIKKQALELSDEAAARIRQLLDARHMVCLSLGYVLFCQIWMRRPQKQLCLSTTLPQEYLKVGVKKRGCSGLSYTLNYAGMLGKGAEVPCITALRHNVSNLLA